MWKQKQMKQILKLKEPFINYEKILRDSPPKNLTRKSTVQLRVQVRWYKWIIDCKQEVEIFFF